MATQLAAIVADPAIVANTTDVELVSRTRLALRWWCRGMLHDVAPVHHEQVAAKPGLIDLARHPLGVLQRLLSHDPDPVALRKVNVDPDAADRAHAQWRKLLNAVEFTMYEWDIADSASKTSIERSRATVADVAAVAEAAAVLDQHLPAGSPSTSSPPGHSSRDCYEIGVAAQHVQRLAAAEALPPVPPLRPAPHRLRPVRVRRVADVPAALANLATLITAATHLGPGTVGALATGHARALDTLATLLTATGPAAERAARHRVAAHLRQLGDALVDIGAAARRLRSIDADDPRPGLQMFELQAGLRHIAGHPTLQTTDAAQKALFVAIQTARMVPTALAASTEAHVRDRRWLQPAQSEQLRWVQIDLDPSVLAAARLAANQSHVPGEALPVARRAVTAYQRPSQALAPLLDTHRRQAALAPQPNDSLAFG